MKLLAALAIGTCCALLAAALLGTMPRRRHHAARPRRLAARRERGDLWLQQAGVGMGLLPFWAGSAFAGFFAVMVIATLTGSVFVAAVPGFAVAFIPRAYFGRRRRDRLRQVQLAWPDGLRDLVSSIAAGNSLTQAVTSLAETGPVAMRVAFERFPQLARVLGTGPALELMKEDLADPTSSNIYPYADQSAHRGRLRPNLVRP